MHSTDPNRLTTSDGYSGVKTAPMRAAALPDEDRRLLKQLLQQPDIADRPFLGHVLRHKISATVQGDRDMCNEVVTGSTCVTYSVDGGPAQTGLLHHRARTISDTGVIPVCSNLGATLIGMQVGQRAPLLREDGTIASLRVLDVEPAV